MCAAEQYREILLINYSQNKHIRKSMMWQQIKERSFPGISYPRNMLYTGHEVITLIKAMLVTDPGYSNHSQQPDIKKILANGTCQNENKKGKEHFRKHS